MTIEGSRPKPYPARCSYRPLTAGRRQQLEFGIDLRDSACCRIMRLGTTNRSLCLPRELFLQNRYRIVRRIGQGGMGRCEALHEENAVQTVALKETFHADGEVLRKAFQARGAIAGRPRASCTAEGHGLLHRRRRPLPCHAVCLGRRPGGQLTRRNSPFPVDEVVGWALQLLDVIEYLHSQDHPILP